MSEYDAAVQAALSYFRIDATHLEPLTGGTLNRVLRVDTVAGAYALKEYTADVLRSIDLQRACEAQEIARRSGLPVPRLARGADDGAIVSVAARTFTLAEFVPGRVYGVDAMPDDAARRMGEMLAKLQAALSKLPPSQAPELWARDSIKAHLEELLWCTEARGQRDAVDERAGQLIRQKLRLLDALDAVPTYEPGWAHGDYQHTNVLFDKRDEVVGIIDFDAVSYYSPARDVMRCIALSFPSLGPAAFAFFEGYASAKGLSPEEARGYVDFYRYISSYRVWPASARYLEPESYDPRWDEFIQPFPDWDWVMLSERFAEIATEATGPADAGL